MNKGLATKVVFAFASSALLACALENAADVPTDGVRAFDLAAHPLHDNSRTLATLD